MDELLDGLPFVNQFQERLWLYRIIFVLAVIAITIVINLFIKYIVKKFIKKCAGKNKRADTLSRLAINTISYAVKFIALLEILKVGVGVDVTSLLLAAGIIGLAVGFGAQSLVRDVIAGFFLLFEDQYDVGDKVTIGALTGEVRELGLRSTRILCDDNKMLYIPNGAITQVINHSRVATIPKDETPKDEKDEIPVETVIKEKKIVSSLSGDFHYLDILIDDNNCAKTICGKYISPYAYGFQDTHEDFTLCKKCRDALDC